jgi:hypothetical protein
MLIIPMQSFASIPDPHAQAVADQSNQTYKPGNMIGAPDDAYTDFFRKEAWILLDMGQLTTSDLKTYFKLLDYGAKFRVEFKDQSLNTVHTGGNIFPLKTNQITTEYPKNDPYRFVFIFNSGLDTFKLDAVELTEPEKSIALPNGEEGSSEPEEPDESEEPETPTETTPQPGDLISLPDDGDTSTQTDSAVYLIGNDNKRHAFPNVTTYMSWYNGFADVLEVNQNTLSTFSLGANTTIRPGTYLVKTMTSPKVYAIEPGGVLRWVETEQIAIDLYGDNWRERVVEIPDVFFNDYMIGDPIEAAVHPTGTLGGTPNGETVYIQNGTMYTVSGMQMEDLRLSPAFKVNLTAEEMALYIDGGSLDFAESLAYPHFAHQMEPTEQ